MCYLQSLRHSYGGDSSHLSEIGQAVALKGIAFCHVSHSTDLARRLNRAYNVNVLVMDNVQEWTTGCLALLALKLD